jgi:hypothetical protein
VEAALARSFLKHDPATERGRMIANVYRDVDRDGQRVLDYEEACAGLAMMHWAFTQEHQAWRILNMLPTPSQFHIVRTPEELMQEFVQLLLRDWDYLARYHISLLTINISLRPNVTELFLVIGLLMMIELNVVNQVA